MGQSEVLEFIETHEGWITTKEVAEQINASTGSVVAALSKLEHQGYVEMKKAKTFPQNHLWKYLK